MWAGAGATLVFAALLCSSAAVSPHAKPVKGVAKHPHKDTHKGGEVHQQALLQASSGRCEGADSLNDECVVEENFKGKTVNEETLKDYLGDKDRSLSDVGLIDDLMVRTACCIRLESQRDEMTGGGTKGKGLSTTDLQKYLESRRLSTTGSKDQLFDSACAYLSNELIVLDRTKMTYDALKDNTATLKSLLAEMGFMSTTGSPPELITRLGTAYKNVETIQKLLGDATFSADQVTATMTSRGMKTMDGDAPLTMDKKLQQLADHLTMQSENTLLPGISEHCDMVVESGVCMAGGQKVLAGDAVPKGLVGRWTFDDAHGLDSSGESHHVKEGISSFGPGINGLGSSVKFDGSGSIEIPHTEALESQDFCLTLWLFLLTDSTGQWRTLVHKGERDHERTPTLFLEPQTRGLEFFVSTLDDSQEAGERVWSNSFVPMRRWTHIAACAENRNLRLYINGILDAENTTVATPVHNVGPMYVGNDPWRPSGGVNGYVDEMKYYTRMLQVDEIQAEAQSALGLCEPSFAELGCMGCSIDNCPKTCRSGYRMCTERDHHMCGYQIARSMGWVSTDTRIWKAEDGKDMTISSKNPPSGLCVCCQIVVA